MTDTKQIDKFKEAAKELECNQSEKDFEAKLRKISQPKKTKTKPAK